MLLITLGAASLYAEFGGGTYLLGALFGAVGLAATIGLWSTGGWRESRAEPSASQPHSVRSGGNMTEPL